MTENGVDGERWKVNGGRCSARAERRRFVEVPGCRPTTRKAGKASITPRHSPRLTRPPETSRQWYSHARTENGGSAIALVLSCSDGKNCVPDAQQAHKPRVPLRDCCCLRHSICAGAGRWSDAERHESALATGTEAKPAYGTRNPGLAHKNIGQTV